MEDKMKMNCEFAGSVIVKLTCIYDGLEALSDVVKVDEFKSDYNHEEKVSKHFIRVKFKQEPLHNEVETLSKAAFDLTTKNNAELEYFAIHMEPSNDKTTMIFELHIKWNEAK